MRKYAKRKTFVGSHQRVVERQRKDDISALKSTGSVGAMAGMELQLGSDVAIGSALDFNVEIFTDGASAGSLFGFGTEFYPEELGWWMARMYVNFSGDPTGDGVLVAQVRLHDTDTLYLERAQNIPVYMATSGGPDYSIASGFVELGPVLIDDSYNRAYFTFAAFTEEMASVGSVAGNVGGSPTPSVAATRAVIYKVG